MLQYQTQLSDHAGHQLEKLKKLDAAHDHVKTDAQVLPSRCMLE